MPYIYFTIVLLAFISSLNSVRLNYEFHLKFFSILLGVTLLVEFCAIYAGEFLHIRNTPLYNVFMLTEFLAYTYYYKLILKSSKIKNTINWFFVLFPIFWIVVVFFIFGINKWNSYLILIGSLFTVTFSVSYYYQIFTSKTYVKLSKSPEFWIATGLLIFYTASIPLLGMLNLLVKNNRELGRVFLKIAQLLDMLMYSIFIYAFLCKTRTTNS